MAGSNGRERLNWFLFMAGYFAAGYLIINWISSRRDSFFDVSVTLDREVPFVPVFIFGYILVYLSVVLVYFVIKDMDDWRRVVVSFLFSTTLAYLIFLLFPVRMDMRPLIENPADVSNAVARFYYFIDLPYNCFPSLHVTYPTLATLVAWKNHRLMRWIFAVMAVVVAVSVVLVKQHYLADVVGGFVNAVLGFSLAIFFCRRTKPLSV